MSKAQFDVMYDASKEDIDKALKEKNRERVRKSWKRDFEKQYDQFSEEIDKAEHDILVMDENIEKYDLSEKINLMSKIEKLEKIKKYIAEEYNKIFGEPIEN